MKFNVVVIDGNPDTLDVVTNIFKIFLFDVEPICFSNPEDAFEFMEVSKPDLLILDIMLPDIGGFKFVEIIRGVESLHDLPIIFLSVKTDADTVAHALDVADDLVQKPFDNDVFTDAVKSLLKI